MDLKINCWSPNKQLLIVVAPNFIETNVQSDYNSNSSITQNKRNTVSNNNPCRKVTEQGSKNVWPINEKNLHEIICFYNKTYRKVTE